MSEQDIGGSRAWQRDRHFCPAAPSGPVTYTKVIGAAVQERVGSHPGSMMGLGRSAAAVPPVLASIIAMHGRRSDSSRSLLKLILQPTTILGASPEIRVVNDTPTVGFRPRSDAQAPP